MALHGGAAGGPTPRPPLEAQRRARQAPSWIGTLIVAIAVAALCARAALELRRAVAPPTDAAPQGAASR
jgi:hypothetical protein